MVRVQHIKLQKLNELFSYFNQLQNSFLRADFNWMNLYEQLLNNSETFFQEEQLVGKAAEIKMIRCNLKVLAGGYNPNRKEKIFSGKRQAVINIGISYMQQTLDILNNETDKTQLIIDTANEIVIQLLLAGIQDNIIPSKLLSNNHTQDELEAIWAVICKEPALRIGVEKLLFTVSKYDVLILLDKSFMKMQF